MNTHKHIHTDRQTYIHTETLTDRHIHIHIHARTHTLISTQKTKPVAVSHLPRQAWIPVHQAGTVSWCWPNPPGEGTSTLQEGCKCLMDDGVSI